jgi:hypothetical protein
VIGMLVNPKIPASKDHIGEQQAAASALGLSLQIVEASSERDFVPAFASLAANRASARYVDGDSLFHRPTRPSGRAGNTTFSTVDL